MARLLPAGLAFFICFSISQRTALLQHCFPWLPCYRGAVLLASVLPQSNPPLVFWVQPIFTWLSTANIYVERSVLKRGPWRFLSCHFKHVFWK